MKVENFIDNFRESLEIEDPNLSLESNIQELEEWDSMTGLLLISFVIDEFRITLDVDDLLELTTIQSLIEKIGLENFEV